MRKLYFILLLMLSAYAQGQTGTYEVTFQLYSINQFKPITSYCDSHVYGRFHLSDGSESLFFEQPVGDGENMPRRYQKKFSANNPLTSIRIQSGVRTYHGGIFGGCKTDDSYDGLVSFAYGYHETNANIQLCRLFGFDGYWSILPLLKIHPNAENTLPFEDKVTISSDTGFRSEEYNWEYSRDGSTWIALPQFKGQSSILIGAEDVLPTVTENDWNTNILLRQTAYDRHAVSPVVVFRILPAAPHIIGADYDMPMCNGGADGWIKLYFDRALYPTETMSYSLNNNEMEGLAQIDPEKKTYLITGLSSKTYNLHVRGAIHPNGSQFNTYSEGQHHYRNLVIPERPKVTFSVANVPAHCYDGSDGKIAVTASGGVGRYFADVSRKDDPSTLLKHIVFEEGTTGYLTELHAGDYLVNLTDTNHCEPSVPQLPITVTQPAAPLALYGLEYKEPLGFGRSDGEAWVNISGGTEAYTVVWTNENGTPYPSEPLTTVDGTHKRSLVKGLKKGTYTVYVTDQNFPLVDPKTQANECGCVQRATIFVDEPPLLEVAIEETHYVTCYGDNDGELTAHAQGGRPYIDADNQPLPYDYTWYKVTSQGDSLCASAKDSVFQALYTGQYKVRITDRNKIETLSPAFHLTQPDPLVVKTNVLKAVACDGGDTGEAEVVVTGGTKPYSYFWDTGDTTRVVKGLARGIYSVFVRDGRYLDSQTHYCTQETHVEMTAPDSLNVEAVVVEPTCNSYTDGSVSLTVTGGAEPYTYLWEDGKTTTPNRKELMAGDYHVTITDANGCDLIWHGTLHEPAPLKVSLGEDLTLCKDRSTQLSDAIHTDGITYHWTKDGKELSTDSIYATGTAGTYRLTVSNTAGCTAFDEITVSVSPDELVSDFVVASQIPNDSVVRAVNITRMEYDRVEWLMPAEAVVKERTNEYASFSIPANGSYTLGMAGYKGACKDVIYKTVEVKNRGDITEDSGSEPFLRKFTVSPNPQAGNFDVIVELREPGDYTLNLCDGAGKVVESKTITASAGGRTTFAIPATAGTYYLRFLSDGAMSEFKMVFN